MILQVRNTLLKQHFNAEISTRYLFPQTISLQQNEPTILLSHPAPSVLGTTQTAFITQHLQNGLSSL